MNKIKNIVILFLAIVLVLIYMKNVQQGKFLNEKVELSDSLSENNAFIKDALMLQISLYDNRDIILNLEDILSDSIYIVSPILLYRCSGMMCQSCIDADMASLSHYIQRIKKENILILPSKEKSKDGNAKVKSIWGNYRCINIDNGRSAFPIDEEGMSYRYFAVMDTDKHVKEVFFPNLSNMVTACYFEYVYNKYFK